MRTLVTGAGNPFGAAIAQALLDAGHDVRLFAVDAGVAARFRSGKGTVTWYAGDVATMGSLEPALSERQALVHAASLDGPEMHRHGQATHIERAAMACRYAAEREQVDHYIVVLPAEPGRKLAATVDRAEETARKTRGTINVAVLRAQDPQQAARDVLAALQRLPELGKAPGRENDAVTA